MGRFSSKVRVFAALLGGRVDRVPATSIAGCGGTVVVDMQKSTGIYWPEAHRDPEKMAKLAISSHELTGLECVRVPFDFVIEPEALGCEVRFPATIDAVPMVYGHPYAKPEDLKMPRNILEMGRIPVLLEAIRIVRREVGDFLPISSLILGPFTLAGELAGIEKLLIWCIRKPDYVRSFVNFATDFLIEFGKAQYRAGSDIVEVGEPSASSDLISPNMFTEFVKPELTRIAKELRGLKVLHICGKTHLIIADMAECGYHGISIDENVDIKKSKSVIGDVKILGNISSTSTLFLGSPNKVKVEVKKAIEAGVDLLEPACGLVPSTPLENIKAMVEATKEFGQRS